MKIESWVCDVCRAPMNGHGFNLYIETGRVKVPVESLVAKADVCGAECGMVIFQKALDAQMGRVR